MKCSSVLQRLRPDVSVVRFHDTTADGEPNAGSLRLGGEERVEHLLPRLFGQACAFIAYGDHDLTHLIQLGAHRKLAVAAGVFHRFDSVHCQVKQQLLNLYGVNLYNGNRWIQIEMQEDSLPDSLVAQ